MVTECQHASAYNQETYWLKASRQRSLVHLSFDSPTTDSFRRARMRLEPLGRPKPELFDAGESTSRCWGDIDVF